MRNYFSTACVHVPQRVFKIRMLEPERSAKCATFEEFNPLRGVQRSAAVGFFAARHILRLSGERAECVLGSFVSPALCFYSCQNTCSLALRVPTATDTSEIVLYFPAEPSAAKYGSGEREIVNRMFVQATQQVRVKGKSIVPISSAASSGRRTENPSNVSSGDGE